RMITSLLNRLGLQRIPRPVSASPRLPLSASSTSLPPDLARIIGPQAAYRWLLPQLSAITPQYIEMVLRGAMQGSYIQIWQLFDLMEDTWPRLVKDLNELKHAVQALDWQLEPWAEEDEPPT